ncbi:unnamed protein product [Tuber aestivum]|uniref:Uncharacterized protein n=1 Tax=Tuber aestivum TaxID=59557 RepID=A0A292PIH3_9PEZI|nr:unnamed protein product [Tuber aestivum]
MRQCQFSSALNVISTETTATATWTLPLGAYLLLLSTRVALVRRRTKTYNGDHVAVSQNDLGAKNKTELGKTEFGKTEMSCDEGPQNGDPLSLARWCLGNYLKTAPMAMALAAIAELNGGNRRLVNYALGALFMGKVAQMHRDLHQTALKLRTRKEKLPPYHTDPPSLSPRKHYMDQNQIAAIKHPHLVSNSTAPPPPPPPPPQPTPIRSSLNLLVLAESNFDTYDLITSQNLFNEHLALFPHPRAIIHFNLAAIHLLLSSPREALSSLRTATSIDPYLAVAQYQLGALFLHFGDLGAARKAYQSCRNIMCGEAVDYEQVGMKFVLWPEMVNRGLEACEGIVGKLGSVPAGILFRVCDRKARVRNMGVRRGSWAFGEEGRVLAVGGPGIAIDRRGLNDKRDGSVKGFFGEDSGRMEKEKEREGKAKGVLKWFRRK